MDLMSLGAAANAGQDRTPARPGFLTLPLATRASIGLVTAAGLGCTAVGLAHLTIIDLPLVAGLLALSVITSIVKVDLPLPGGGSTLALSYIINMLSILTLDPWLSVPIGAAGAWSQCTFRVKKANPWYQTVFSMATLAVSVALAGLAYRAGWVVLPESYWAHALAIMAGATVYFLVNTGLVGLVIAVSSGDSLWRVWSQEFLWSSPSYYIGALIAVVAVEVTQGDRYWWAVVLALPAYLIFRSYGTYAGRIAEEQRQVRQMSDVQLAMVEALALAIEAKDNTSQHQLERMQVYSEGLARALSMTEPEIRGVKTAALLHDIGNLAVPEHILAKSGPLSYDEYDRLKIHPRVGADIIKSVPFPYPVVPLILAHHERWDGRGYPSGLRGLDIPIGARILAVVDTFTAMLTDRPYRMAHSYAEAIATLRENSGSALDPAMVERFIEVLPSIESQWQGVRSRTQAAQLAESSTGDQPTVTALQDIAVAHREEQLLREIGQSLSSSLRVSDALSLISTRVVNMMPLDACALFMVDHASELFLCSHVVGAHQDAIRGTTAGTIDSLRSVLPTPPGAAPAGSSRLQSVIVASLETDAGTIGALAVYHSARNAYTADHRRLLSRVADHAANVIANAIVFEETHEQSLTDALTGLPNRRYVERHLSQEFARIRRHGSQVSVLVLDMDGFKQINDEFGHSAGDRALKEVSQVLRASLRVYDVCARFAGDEFISVLSECDSTQAERRRAELQNEIARLCIEPEPGHTIWLSASIGAATFPDDGQAPEDVVAEADRRMYQDKQGRQRRRQGREALVPKRR